MDIQSIVFKDVCENDVACLLYLIDRQIDRVIPDVDLVLVVEEIEASSLTFFPRFYPDLLTLAWNYSFKKVARAAIVSNSFTDIEQTIGLSLYWSVGCSLIVNLFYPPPLIFQIQFFILMLGFIIFILAWRKRLNRRSRICADRLTIVCYLMERNLDEQIN